MKRYCLILILLCANFCVQAQFIQDISGKPVLTKNYLNIKGSAYLYNDWQKGIVKLNNGKVYKNVFLKYDLVNDELFFKKPSSDEILGFVDDIFEFSITTDVKTLNFKKGFPPAERFTKNSFYEILQGVTVTLLKKQTKVILETKAYNAASTDRQFDENIAYYVFINNKTERIKKDKKSLIAALSDKKDAVEEYINKEKLKFKTDEELIAVIKFYNEL